MDLCGGGGEKQIYGCANSVVCPKPRRICLFENPITITDQIRCRQTELSDSRARDELFDIIRSMGDKSTSQVASSPPFFIGSPPSRVSNPLIADSKFGCDEATPFSPAAALAISPSSSGLRGSSCSRAKYGNKPVAVRIEGFNCLSVA